MGCNRNETISHQTQLADSYTPGDAMHVSATLARTGCIDSWPSALDSASAKGRLLAQ